MGESIILTGEYRQQEAEVTANVTPGELVEFASDGRIQPHSSVPDLNGNGSAAGWFAREFPETGKGIDDDYTYDGTADEGENAKLARPTPGSKVYAWLDAGESVDPSTPLESAGNGALQAHTGLATTGDGTGAATETVADDLVVAYPAESVDNSAGTDPVRIEVYAE